jgi:hypothetical protein
MPKRGKYSNNNWKRKIRRYLIMFKLLIIALVFVFLFTTASAFSEVESYEDAIPLLQEFGEKLYQTIIASFDFGQELIDVWGNEEV